MDNLSTRRAVLSCARCRRRKIKVRYLAKDVGAMLTLGIQCDRAIPCSQCISAKTACTGFSSRDQDPTIPRSIVQHLESEIAKVEGELARNGHLEELNASDILAGMPTQNGIPLESQGQGAPLLEYKQESASPRASMSISEDPTSPTFTRDAGRDEIMNCGELQAMIFSILPTGPGVTDLVARVRMSLTPSTAIASGSPRDARRRSISRQGLEVSCNMLRSIPAHIIKSLIKKYMRTVYPIFPVLHSPTLWQQMDKVIKTLQNLPEHHRMVPPSYDFLVIYIMLSTSATLGSAKSGSEARHMLFSGSLFEEGIQHLSERAQIPSDLAGIQITLMILQYAAINPRLANVWMLSGTTMRAILELGLHREPPASCAFDKLTLDLRRRVFWTAYGFDRSVCSALQRPLSIPDQTIDAHFPSILDDQHIHPTGIDTNGKETKMHMLRWIQFRRLQSTMTEVHFQGKPLDQGQTWEDWLEVMEQRLRAWYTDYNDGHELTEFALAHGLTNLHRPSPRVPMPAPRSLMSAFEAACGSAKSLRDHINNGFYRRSWLIATNCLEDSMVVLFCLRHGFETISSHHNATSIFEMTKVFTANFLSLAAQGWNEVSNYAGTYERLLGPLLESVFQNRPPSLSTFGPAQEAELTRLLYPGPAQLDKLRFGSRSFGADELPPFDVTSINWEDFSVSDGNSVGPDYGIGGWDLLDSIAMASTPSQALTPGVG
jgi:Fungal specific transcription factor domain